MSAMINGFDPTPGLIARREAERLLRQVSIGVGALLLAAVDDWNLLAQRHPAHLQTALRGLGRGAYVAAVVSAGIDVWLGSHGQHPPHHSVAKPYRWSEIASQGKTYLVIHHNEMTPTNERRKAFIKQDSRLLALEGIPGDPTHCELTWEYDVQTDSHVRSISITAPGAMWEPISVPMAKAQAQYATWRKRDVKWLPGRFPSVDPAAVEIPTREVGGRPKPGLTTRRRDEATGQDAG